MLFCIVNKIQKEKVPADDYCRYSGTAELVQLTWYS